MTDVARSRLIILLAALAGALFFLHLLGVLREPEAWLIAKLSGSEAGLTRAGQNLKTFMVGPFRAGELEQENARLREEATALLADVARLKSMEEENARLRELLAFSERQSVPPVVAHVIARTPEAGTHTILIDRGSNDGLAVDMPVVAADGVLVGKIFKVDASSSIALLLTDSRSRVGASVQNEAHTQGVLQGDRGLTLEMRLIPQNEAIAAGDVVVTSGIEPLTPRGLVIGRVDELRTQEKNPFKTATIASPVAYDRLSVVAVPFP